MKRVVSYILWWNIMESLWDTQKTIDCVTFGTLSPNTNTWWKLYRWRWRWSSMWANGEYEQRCRCVRSPNCHFYGDAPQLCYWISGGHRFSDNALDGEDDHDHRCCEITLKLELLEAWWDFPTHIPKTKGRSWNSNTRLLSKQFLSLGSIEMMMAGWLWNIKKFMNVNAWVPK